MVCQGLEVLDFYLIVLYGTWVPTQVVSGLRTPDSGLRWLLPDVINSLLSRHLAAHKVLANLEGAYCVPHNTDNTAPGPGADAEGVRVRRDARSGHGLRDEKHGGPAMQRAQSTRRHQKTAPLSQLPPAKRSYTAGTQARGLSRECGSARPAPALAEVDHLVLSGPG